MHQIKNKGHLTLGVVTTTLDFGYAMDKDGDVQH